MTVLDTLYVSDGRRILYNTLEISDGESTIRIVEGWEDIAAGVGNGLMAEFTAAAIQTAMPSRNADGTQDLQFAVCNVDGQASTLLRKVISSGRRATVINRHYIEGYLSEPAYSSGRLTLKDGGWTAMQADLRAGYMNILDSNWLRRLYTLIEFPGLRYL